MRADGGWRSIGASGASGSRSAIPPARRSLMQRRRSRVWSALVIGLVLVAAACRTSSTRNVRVVVPRGANLRVAAESLQKAHVIRNATVFRFYAMLRGRDRSIRAGTYMLAPRMSWGEVLDALHGGKGIEVSITIPEGWSLQQIVPQLARVLKVPAE